MYENTQKIWQNQYMYCLLKFVNADKNQDVSETVAAFFVRRISHSWITLLVAPIGVQNGWKKDIH